MAKSLNGENFISKHNKRTTQEMAEIQGKKHKNLSWPGQTLDLLLMIKSFVTGAAAFAVSALAPLSVSAAPVFQPRG